MPRTAIHEVQAELFRALGHPVRLLVLETLVDGERTVAELHAALGLDDGGASGHLAVLRKEGLVESRREGANVVYRLRGERIAALLDVSRTLLLERLEHTEELLGDLARELAEDEKRQQRKRPRT